MSEEEETVNYREEVLNSLTKGKLDTQASTLEKLLTRH